MLKIKFLHLKISLQKIAIFSALHFLAYCAFAQTVTFPKNDINDSRQNLVAFTNAKIFIDHNTVIEKGTLLIKGGRIVEAGSQISIPAEAVIVDCTDKWIYPSFIEAESDYGMPAVQRGSGGFFSFDMNSKKKGPFAWNQAIQPENDAQNIFTVNAAQAAELRKAGIGSVLVHNHDGIARGTSFLATLVDEKEQIAVVKSPVASHYSYNKGSSTQSYPNSLLGSVALLRQSYLDAAWYKNQKNQTEFNASLDAFNKNNNLPQIFDAGDKLGVIRADAIGDEFGTQYIIIAGGDEYQKLAEVKKTNAKLIVPVNFPANMDVDDPIDAHAVSLTELKHWEMAATNPAKLIDAGLEIALTSSKLKSKNDFIPNIQKAIEYGLSEQNALKALTTTPANMLKINDLVGAIKPGLLANFLITDGNIFNKNNQILENWVKGNKYSLQNTTDKDIRGKYKAKIGSDSFDLNITGKRYQPEYQIVVNDSLKVSPKVSRNGNMLSIKYNHPKNKDQQIRISGYLTGENLNGTGENNEGKILAFEAIKQASPAEVAKIDTAKVKKPETGAIIYPFTAFGNTELPKAENLLIKNATVWTNEKEGVLQNTDVLLENGKIKRIGKNINSTNSKTVDGTGKYLTSGIIDEHSHIALLSINEGGQSVTAEVRTSDVVDPDDIDIYRQLAGGTTAAQLLHGSANSIGGQSTLIKLKWGESIENLKIANAPLFIKFALGENVTRKGAQSGNNNGNMRYPISRMGVEQVMTDAFTRAQAYDKEWKAYNNLKVKESGQMPRKDLEMEALAEIINKKRFITCHSYVQSEINMMMKVAEAFNFNINTFTHILEGYKLADIMAKHGAGGSTFSDWWAYKMEVRDAIPYNAALMHKAGVIVAINSDDAEMARRLNQEAAKTITYGGLTEVEAWKTVTLNPAKLLHLDDRMGSIKVGKDADLVLWNANPLSVYARPEKTIIDGAVYFDRDTDLAKQDWLVAERARLIKKMSASKTEGAAPARPFGPKMKVHNCEDEREGF